MAAAGAKNHFDAVVLALRMQILEAFEDFSEGDCDELLVLKQVYG